MVKLHLNDITAALAKNAAAAGQPESMSARDLCAGTRPTAAPGFAVDIEITRRQDDGSTISIKAHAGSPEDMERLNAAYYAPRRRFLGVI